MWLSTDRARFACDPVISAVAAPDEGATAGEELGACADAPVMRNADVSTAVIVFMRLFLRDSGWCGIDALGSPDTSLAAATEQETDEQPNRRRNAYCAPWPFAHMALGNLGRITGSSGDRSRHLFGECPCRGDAGIKVGFGTGQIVTGQRSA